MTISVALCTYNGADYLSQQLDSIFAQKKPVNEIIVCDDGSSDNTAAILYSYREKYPDIVLLHFNKTNLGYVKNFEKALTLTSGDIIFLCDQDDTWMPDKTDRFLETFLQNPNCYGIFSDAQLIDSNGNLLEGTLWESICFKERKELQKSNELLYDHILKTYNVVTGCCSAITREALGMILPINPPFWEIHDEYIALRLSAKNGLIALNECLTCYRVHQKQKVSVPGIDEREALRKEKEMLEQTFFVGYNTYNDMSRAWIYYKRRIYYEAVHSNNQELLKSSYNYFLEFKQSYLSSLSFFKRKKAQLSWWKNNLYNS